MDGRLDHWQIILQIIVNGYSILDDDLNAVGTGIYLAYAVFHDLAVSMVGI